MTTLFSFSLVLFFLLVMTLYTDRVRVCGEREAERKSRVANRRKRSEGQAITHTRGGERIKRTGHHKDEENAKKNTL
jgi:hypothetical protein